VSRQAYYKDRKQNRIRDKDEALILTSVRQMRKEQVKLGTKKVFNELREEIRKCGRGMGRDKFFDLLRRHDLLIRRKRKYAITTNSNHPFYKYRNELEKSLITSSNRAWVSDITYLRTREGFVYLSLITDVFSRKIVGWQVDRSLGVEGTVKALNKAIGQCSNTEGLIHHSDRGLQYCSYPYTEILKKKGIIISMGAVGNCYENAIAERVNGILKDEYLLDSKFADINQAQKATEQAIFLYNNKRPHWSLNLKKPEEVHQLSIKMSAGNQN
jgi:transposase InsO family protein